MNENRVIESFAKIHGLKTHSADAERFGNWLFSMDSFSETEDFFTATPPGTIGHDIAVGACSDLLACGVRPQFLLQSWNLDPARTVPYYQEIARGVERVLAHYGARCIGGDVGSAAPWCWTATVGAAADGMTVTRVTRERIPFDLYVSHPMGEANLAAITGEPMGAFSLNDPVPPDSLFATDSSGGFFDALENFRRVNTGMRLTFELMKKVISPSVVARCPKNLNPAYCLIGGVGEYELLYAVPRGTAAPGIKIGEGDFSADPENRFEWELGRMKSPPPDYRELAPEQWIEATGTYWREMMEK